MTVRTGETNLDWLLDDLIHRVPGADRAVVLSSDGLLKGRSADLPQPDAEHLAAVASAYQSLSRATGQHFGGGQVRQTVVDMEQAFLLVVSAGQGACLALLAAPGADLGLLAYEMNLLVKRVGAQMKTEPRGTAAGRSA